MLPYTDADKFVYDKSEEEEEDVFLTIYPSPEDNHAVLVLEIDETEVADCLYTKSGNGYAPADKNDLINILKKISKQLGLDKDNLKRISQEMKETMNWCVPKNKSVSFEIHFDGEIELLEV